ncbi:hypothetical protein [Arthrobacter sp. PAMC25284]|uniref:hypothetical protein n=1 Tax=Arthrobacter sp. PAMC25284 TaxID=2861279 RepID=UPI001C62B910|nr:hypothetical protein [Arthrobacter sp. PAMC25284]QYF88475.1 hypothetical protein KY499_09240 [Arthrobacter sp. PAMC25284]
MLTCFRERTEVRHATRGRRVYAFISAAVVLGFAAWVFNGGAQLWAFFAAFAVVAVADELLIRSWIHADAPAASRAGTADA